jgi:hypothetical protein
MYSGQVTKSWERSLGRRLASTGNQTRPHRSATRRTANLTSTCSFANTTADIVGTSSARHTSHILFRWTKKRSSIQMESNPGLVRPAITSIRNGIPPARYEGRTARAVERTTIRAGHQHPWPALAVTDASFQAGVWTNNLSNPPTAFPRTGVGPPSEHDVNLSLDTIVVYSAMLDHSSDSMV